MVIRRMREEDVPEAAGLEAANFSEPWSGKAFLDALANASARYLVAEENGRIAGYCGLWQCMDEGEVMNVSVDKNMRGQGIAFAMMEELEKEGREMGVTAFTLEVRESNTAAIRLYEKCGYLSEGIRPNFYSRPKENAVIMWKR